MPHYINDMMHCLNGYTPTSLVRKCIKDLTTKEIVRCCIETSVAMPQ